MFMAWFIFLTLILLVLIGIVGISWYISNRLLHRPGNSLSFRIQVVDMSTKTITLQKTANTKRPGVFGITGADGQAIIGPILSSDTETVTRDLIYSTGSLSNTKVAWNTTVYGGALKNQLELTIADVRVPGALGDMPAWYVPGKRKIWAILAYNRRTFFSFAKRYIQIAPLRTKRPAMMQKAKACLLSVAAKKITTIEASNDATPVKR